MHKTDSKLYIRKLIPLSGSRQSNNHSYRFILTQSRYFAAVLDKEENFSVDFFSENKISPLLPF